ncbi:thioesterase [Micromonospora sp. WMMA1947]|uniref:thioesterase n=1 Tax=Micromonospora sp. WMMA1947 TaxID=3015163 RepID=UPI00248C5512|nr:thioesterase [Micromonospora sp. WMMA1947]WBC07490.1 thioesterase [Micromonospora sp. WMMA1947]
MTTTHIAGPNLAAVLRERTRTRLRPRYEGANICTWIGFKHVNYLVEEAVLEHLRSGGLAPGELYERYGLGVDLVDLDTRVLHAFHIDDVVLADVTPLDPVDGELAFSVVLHVDGDEPIRAATARVRVVLRRDSGDTPEAPPELRPITTPAIRRTERKFATAPGGNEFHWSWRIPYFYCHFTERLQMSGYLRLMEEAVDLFLEQRGISIRTLLDEQDWIPVVPRSRVTILDEVRMEQELDLVFTVQNVFKGLTYDARLDWYVQDQHGRRLVAVGHITHGYALIENRRDWHLVEFDERMLNALSSPPAGATAVRDRGRTATGEPRG